MDSISLVWIAELLETTTEIAREHLEAMEVKPTEIKQDVNGLEFTLEVYDFWEVEEVGKRIYGRDISEDYELTDFNKMLKKWLDYKSK